MKVNSPAVNSVVWFIVCGDKGDTMRIALTSMDIRWEDKSVNREKCEELIKRASDSGARLILFPEMTLTGFTMNIEFCGEIPAADMSTETIRFFLGKSREYGIAAGFGYISREEHAEKGKNHFVVCDRGELLGDYVKIHPFSYGSEKLFYEGGNQLASVEIDDMKMGMFICYDLRFPEIFQKSSEENQVMAVIANWPKKRVSHWKSLLQARAIENQSAVIGVNRKGSGGGLEYESSTMAFDCGGEQMAMESIITSYGDECLLCDLNVKKIEQKRKEFPVRQDRKKELYKLFYEE